MKSILMTGVTGFVGSSLAAQFLLQNHRIVALSRNDPEGKRTRGAIREAARGFGSELSLDQLSRVTVLDVDFTRLEALANQPAFQTVTEAWHSAAEMTYNPRKLEQSISQNLNATYQLYKLLDQQSNCQRFYYISTAYTAGMNTRFVQEKLHLDPVLVNVYQTSKWSAEMSLAQAHQEGRLPVTLFRPSIVVGHQQTGWHGRSVFGFYAFVRGMAFAQHVGSPALHLDTDPEAEINMIPIDALCAHAVALSDRAESGSDLEIFHATAASSFKGSRICEIASEILGFPITNQKPHCTVGRAIDRRVKQNAAFARRTWTFDATRLQTALGKAWQPFHMNEVTLRILIRNFVAAEIRSLTEQQTKGRLRLAAMRLQVQKDKFGQVARTWSKIMMAKIGLNENQSAS